MNFQDFTAMLQAAPEAQAVRILTTEELQKGLYLEALQYMSKKLRDDQLDKPQLVFNQAIATGVNDTNFVMAEHAMFPQDMVTLLGGAITRLNTARQVDDKDAVSLATQGLESFLNFITSLSSSIARSSFYMHRRAEEVEAKSIGKDGKLMPLDLRTEYAGFAGNVFAEPDAVIDAADSIINDLMSVHGQVSKFASSWFQKNRVFNCGGFYQDEVFVNFLSAGEVRLHMQAELNRNVSARVSPKEAAAALTNMLRPAPVVADTAEPVKPSKPARKPVTPNVA